MNKELRLEMKFKLKNDVISGFSPLFTIELLKRLKELYKKDALTDKDHISYSHSAQTLLCHLRNQVSGETGGGCKSSCEYEKKSQEIVTGAEEILLVCTRMVNDC